MIALRPDRLARSCGGANRVIPFLILLQAACGDDPTGRSGAPALVATVQTIQIPDTAYSGESIELRFRVIDRQGLPIEGQSVAFAAQDGAVASSEGITDARGEVSVHWSLADREERQTLTATAGTKTTTVAVHPWPRLVALVLASPAALPLGGSATLAAQARTATGRVAPWPHGFMVELVAEDRALAELPVLAIRAPGIEAVGPGRATIRAVAGNLASAPATLAVPRGPILLRVEPADLPQGGGPARLIGHDLDLLTGALTLNGARATVLAHSPTTIELAVPPAPASCSGRPYLPVGAEGAWQPNGKLTVHRPLGGELAFAIGAVHRLGTGASQCVRLGGAAGAEYVLGYFDARGIESARGAPEDPNLANVPWSLRVADRSAGLSTTIPAPRAATTSTAASPVDLLLPPVSVAATREPADYFLRRATPWAVGDDFSMPREGSTVFYEHGRIFAVIGPFAFGSLDRDAGYQIPSRLTGISPAVEGFLQFGEPALRRVLIDEWPATTAGSGQTLVVVGRWPSTGFVAVGQGTVDRGVWVGLELGVEGTPLDQPLFLSEKVLYHEMVHTWQDRYAMSRCRDQADCDSDFWWHRWAVEGGAELLSQSMLTARYGLARTGNHPLDGIILNVLGSQWGVGPHFPFDLGYDNASWLLQDLVERAARAGHPLDAAQAAVARGSFEGWFGHRADGGPRRPGLVERLEQLLATSWDPKEAALMGVLTLGADDLSALPELQVPFLRNAWERWPPDASLRIGEGAAVAFTVRGLVFGHYRLQDAEGLGGSIEAQADHPGLVWAIVRVR